MENHSDEIFELEKQLNKEKGIKNELNEK